MVERRDADQLACVEQAADVGGADRAQPGPQPDVWRIRLLRLQADQVLDGRPDRHVRTLQQELASQQRPVQRPVAQHGPPFARRVCRVCRVDHGELPAIFGVSSACRGLGPMINAEGGAAAVDVACSNSPTMPQAHALWWQNSPGRSPSALLAGRTSTRCARTALKNGVHALRPGGRVNVGGVARDQHPSGAVPVHQPMADPEHRRPAYVRRRGGSRGQSVRRGLDVVQFGGAAALESMRHLAAGHLRGGQLVGYQHRHPVPVDPRKRYALEQVVGDAVGLVGDPDAVSGRKGPVDLHVGEHVLLGEWRAVEGESEIPAHQAVRAVASHEIACCDDTVTARIADGGTDAIPVLGEAEEFAAPLDCDTEAGQVLAKEPLRLVLR